MTTAEPFLVREQPLQAMNQFGLALAAATAALSAEGKQALSTALTGECIQCNFRVTGQELATLSETAAAEENKLARLRQGYCARKGCDSYFYRLRFFKHPEIDWTTILPQVESAMRDQAHQSDVDLGIVEAGKSAERKRWLKRVGMGVAAMAVLFMIRQWYFGGTIPIIRQPEKFHVDQTTNTAPVGSSDYED
jgi:hypothetical protein